MTDDTKHEIQILLDLLKSSLTRNCVSMATDGSGNLIFFDTNKYIKDRTFDGIKVNINDIVKLDACMNEIKEYKHSNGYYAKLYGESSMTIYRPDGRMFMHTGFRSVNTENEVMSILKGMPEQEKVMAELMK